MKQIWRNNTDSTLENEIWKDIVGFEDEYMVSNHGRIKSKSRIVKSNKCERSIKGVVKLQNLNTHGYCSIRLAKNGKSKLYSVHRLVAEAFLPNPSNLPVINHKDEDKTNNLVDNLEWCTQKYNTEYSGILPKLKEINSMQVEQYNLQGEFIQSYNSATDAAKAVGGLVSNICACCNGLTGSSYGFVWKFTEKEKTSRTKVHKRRVVQKSLTGEILGYFDSIKEGSAKTGCTQIGIYACCKHKQETTNGFKWEYADDSFINLKQKEVKA